MWRAGLWALLSHWRRHPGQAATLVLGLALATALWTGVQAMNAEARRSYGDATELTARAGQTMLVPRDGDTIPLATYVRLRRAGWAVSPVLEGTITLGGGRVTLIGVDPLSAPLPTDAGEDVTLGEALGTDALLYASPETAEDLRGGEAGALRLTDQLPAGTLLGDIAVVARMLDAPDRLSRLIVLPDQSPDLPPLSDLAPELDRRVPAGPVDAGDLAGSFHLNLTAFGLLAFAVGLYIVHGAAGLAFEQRRSSIRILRALGMPGHALVLLLLAELGALAIIGGLIGVAMGYALAAALLPDVAATLRGIYGVSASGTLSIEPRWIAAGLAMSLLGTAIAAGQSLRRLLSQPIAINAAPRGWSVGSERNARRQSLLALACLVAALGLLKFGEGLVQSFAGLGLLLLSCVLILPWLLMHLLSLCQRFARGPVSEWFWADTRQQLPSLSLALMALLLALAANVGVSTMVGSFRQGFVGWLDQRLWAELYVDAETEAQAAAIRSWLSSQSETVAPIAYADADLGGFPGSVRLLVTGPENWPLLRALPDAWRRFADGDGVLISEQLAYRAHLTPGDMFDLDSREVEVLGVYPDYGNPMPQAALPEAEFTARFPDIVPMRFAARIDADRVSGTSRDLRADLGLRPDQITPGADLKAASLTIFERTFAVTAALNVLTLTVAAIALLTSLLTTAEMRLPQIAPVWALGVTRRRLALLELSRTVMLAGLTALLALPVGLVLGWVLLAVVNVEAFGWRLPMHLFPIDWVRLWLLALLAAGLAGLGPARKLLRRPPAELLGVFTSER
jgi:putative ABC transport system permease protein